MQKDVESTQSLQTKANKSNSWEESLPIKDLGEITPQKFAKTEVLPPQPQISSESFKKKSFNLKKIFFIFLTVVFLGIIASFTIILVQKNQKTVETRKSDLQNLPPSKIILRRLSSAFVPKSPSTEPAKLFVNWKRFEDGKMGLVFFHPEEWEVKKGEDQAIYTIYYPAGINFGTNFESQILAKFSIFQDPPQPNLAEFLLKRYNLDNDNFTPKVVGSEALEFKFDSTFVFAQNSQNRLFIFEGKVENENEFENFLPIFVNIVQSFQILK